jgi:hypothetical protein
MSIGACLADLFICHLVSGLLFCTATETTTAPMDLTFSTKTDSYSKVRMLQSGGVSVLLMLKLLFYKRASLVFY